ncbi:GAF and ANTAR domain-containing protein [Streptomyces olivoreticuli]
MPTPDQRLADAFVALADTLDDSYDIAAFLATLTECSVELLDVGAAAGVVLAGDGPRSTQAAASDPLVARLEADAAQWQEGPCHDCHRSGARLDIGLAGTAARHRWPRYAPGAHALGYTRVSALPLRLRDESVGSLILLYTGTTSLTQDTLDLGQSLADAATIAMLRARQLSESRTLTTQLEGALNSRVLVEQAKGMLASRLALSMNEAFDLLRDYARSHQRKIAAVALDVVEGRVRPDRTKGGR